MPFTLVNIFAGSYKRFKCPVIPFYHCLTHFLVIPCPPAHTCLPSYALSFNIDQWNHIYSRAGFLFHMLVPFYEKFMFPLLLSIMVSLYIPHLRLLVNTEVY